MNKKIKTKWVKALKSGEFKQGKDYLYDSDEDTYCCLGVLAVVCNPKVPKETIKKKLAYIPLPSLSFGEKYGLNLVKSKDGSTIQDYLVGMNDGGDSFETIADYIEKNL